MQDGCDCFAKNVTNANIAKHQQTINLRGPSDVKGCLAMFEQWIVLCNFINLQMAIQTNGNSDDLLRTSVPEMDIGSSHCQTSAMKCKWKLQFHWEKTTRTELRNQKSYCVTRFVSESEWSQKQWQKPISTFEMRAGILFFQSHVSRQEREFHSFSLMLRYENKNCSCWESRLRQFLQECFPIGTDKNVKINRRLTNLGFNELRVREIFNVRRRAALWRQQTFPGRWRNKTKRRNCTKTKKFVLSRGATTNWVFKFLAKGPTTIHFNELLWIELWSFHENSQLSGPLSLNWC